MTTYGAEIETMIASFDFEYYVDGMSLNNRKILIIATLDDLGYDMPLIAWLTGLKGDAFKGSFSGLIITSQSEYYTKSMAQDIILHANRKGLGFVGHSVLEVVKGFKNFQTWEKTLNKPLHEIAIAHGKQLIERVNSFEVKEKKKVLALHSSSRKTSNTLGLWYLVKRHIKQLELNEIHIENGTVVDCKGCSFQTCIHFGQHHSCFYGGIMVEEVLPAIETADTIVWICPNYNDSVSANMLAVINRLTVLYRQISFHEKACYAVIVSGNSGSDSVAKQLIGALNINKGFQLPPYFSIMATANDPLKVLEIEGIEKKSLSMAKRINTFCQKI
jgi:multimeric flavodoxin WrbA